MGAALSETQGGVQMNIRVKCFRVLAVLFGFATVSYTHLTLPTKA